MSKTKHTPGPWVVSADPLHFYSLTTVIGGKESSQKNGPPQQMIVQVGGFAEWQEAEANARLIAAAPEMLEALKLLLNDVGRASSLPGAVKARAAIANAQDGIQRAIQEDGWIQDGYLLYRLTNEPKPRNRDEISVTMVNGSRAEAARTKRASEILNAIRAAEVGKVMK